jgi:hypothetical protein
LGGVWVCVKIFPCGFFYLCIIFFCSVTPLSLCCVYSSIIFFLRRPVKFFYGVSHIFFIDTVSMVVCATIHIVID